MQTSEVISSYVYRTSMTTVWDILFQCLSIFMVVIMFVGMILLIILMIKGIQALGVYIKKSKME